MYFHHRAPRSPLDAFVALIWVFRDNSRPYGLERILPTGAAQLIVNLREDRTRLYETDSPHRCVSTCGTILAGVQSRYQIIDTSEQEYVAGVAFRPGGSPAFVRAPAHETRDENTPLEFLWNRQRTADLREQLLERDDPDAQLDAIENALQERLRPGGMHPAIDFALGAFDRVPLAANIGAVTKRRWHEREALHRAIYKGGGPDTKALLPDSTLLDLPDAALVASGLADAAAVTLARVGSAELGGFWIHLDTDVINPTEMPAVDSPEPGGPHLIRSSAFCGRW